MNALSNMWAKLSRSKKYREAFVAAQLKRGIPAQLRVIRKERGWNQDDLAKASGLTQGAMSRAEDPDYGNLTFNNVLKIAAGLDVAFIGRFVPFSELAHWYTNLSEEALKVPSFKDDRMQAATEHLEARNFGTINATRVLNIGEVTSDNVCFYGTTTQPSVGIPRKPVASTAEAIPFPPPAILRIQGRP